MDSEPDALWEQALQEEEELDLRVKRELDRMWDKYGDELPWKDAGQ